MKLSRPTRSHDRKGLYTVLGIDLRQSFEGDKTVVETDHAGVISLLQNDGWTLVPSPDLPKKAFGPKPK